MTPARSFTMDRLDRTPLSDYLGSIQADRLLTAEEERELAHAIRRDDPEARSRLILCNLRLVVTIARDYVGRGLSLEDLVGEGNIGLMHAVKKFDPSFETRFSTYASYWIKQAIRQALTNTGAVIRLPSHIVILRTRWRRAERSLERTLGGPPGSRRISAELDLRPAQRVLMEHALRASRLGTDGEGFDRIAAIADEHLMDPGEKLERDEALADLAARLACLDARERTVLTLRYGLGGQMPQTLKEVGRKLGVTREWVRKIEQKALVKLQQMTPATAEPAAAPAATTAGPGRKTRTRKRPAAPCMMLQTASA